MFDPQKIKKAEEYLHQCVHEGKIAGCSLLIKDGGKESLYLDSGFSDLKTNVPFQRDTVCRLFSVTKVFTSIAVFKAMELGLFSKEDSLGKFFPELQSPVVEIEGKHLHVPSPSIEQALNMTAGFQYNNGKTASVFTQVLESGFTLSTSEFASRIATLPLLYVPGTKRIYSVSADMLAAIIEKTSGMTYGNFLKKYLFEPAGIPNIGFSIDDEQRKHLSHVYSKTKNGLEEYDQDSLGIRFDGKPNAFESGGGGLFATIDEVSLFADALLSYKILRKETLESIFQEKEKDPKPSPSDWMTPKGTIYKNLVQIRREYDENCPYSSVDEFGWSGWLGCYLAINPSTRRSFVFFTQLVNYGEGEVCKEVRKILY